MQHRFVGGIAACCLAMATAGPAAAAVVLSYSGVGSFSLGFEIPNTPGAYLMKITGSEVFLAGVAEEHRLFREIFVDSGGGIISDEEIPVLGWGLWFFDGLRGTYAKLDLGPTTVDHFSDGSFLTRTERGFVDIVGAFGPGGEDATWAVTLATVPEPATWLTMIAGFGLLGAALRRRGALAATAG